jgi:hypothetical protein
MTHSFSTTGVWTENEGQNRNENQLIHKQNKGSSHADVAKRTTERLERGNSNVYGLGGSKLVLWTLLGLLFEVHWPPKHESARSFEFRKSQCELYGYGTRIYSSRRP